MKTKKLVGLVLAIALVDLIGGTLVLDVTNHTEQSIGFIITAIGNYIVGGYHK